ncbi:hypothetical protein JHK85_010932 [Glycine max]|nr:hypothetical protein JHK85_010932 [Glycine max]
MFELSVPPTTEVVELKLELVKDEIEVETWFDVAGKNGTRRDWIVRDHCTKEIIAKATRFAIAREEIDHQKIQKLTDATTESFRFGVTLHRNLLRSSTRPTTTAETQGP